MLTATIVAKLSSAKTISEALWKFKDNNDEESANSNMNVDEAEITTLPKIVYFRTMQFTNLLGNKWPRF